MFTIISKTLHFGQHSSFRSPQREYQRLWRCNEAPTPEEKVEIMLRVQQLKEELVMKASDLNTSSQERELEATLNLLSCVRIIPPELWEVIFELTLSMESSATIDFTNQDDITLQRLCAVCSLWNTTAKSARSLWTRLPVFAFGQGSPEPINASLYQAVQRRLELYLSLSDPLPISFVYIDVTSVTELDFQYLAVLIIERLMKESHRWREVTLTVPLELMERLSQIRDQIPILWKLSLTTKPALASKETNHPGLDTFSSAPSLRHVTFHPSHRTDLNAREIQAIFPWRQIETYKSESGLGITYQRLLQDAKNTLTAVSFTAVALTFTVPRNIPIILPHLKKLHLRIGQWVQHELSHTRGSMILYHLGQLTLPALEDLEVRESSIDIVDNFYESIVQLVVRSGCSLKRLALDEKIPFTTKTDPSFRQQAELWRELTHIDVRCPPGRDIQSLGSHVLGPGTFTFPYLEVMTLRRHVLERRRRLPNDQTVHPMMLLSVLRSRTSDLSQQTSPLRNDAGSTEFKPLREVVFVYTEPPIGVLSWRLNQLEAFEASGQLPFGDTDVEPNTVELWAKELDQFFKISYSSSRVHINFLGQRAMSALLKQMEELNLEGKRSQILVRRGVVRLLHLASLKKDGTVPGDGIFRFRKRARDLCEKWKPFLLRDHRSSPYRLSSTATRVAATLRIKYVPAGSRDDTDEEAWKDILALDVNE